MLEVELCPLLLLITVPAVGQLRRSCGAQGAQLSECCCFVDGCFWRWVFCSIEVCISLCCWWC
ncbi:hypothetical protein KC19_VG320300 [Ceratodon purpureus]|uniref:Secreted protein n=1 Tax=Ceratodon purpureus TaxID=3225 RepID=A0A8T0HXM7_CERPU|nr:hypothetical protein KC19_VG320300 [Ceratodon purpureus]